MKHKALFILIILGFFAANAPFALADGASLYFSPQKGNYNSGKIFNVDVFVKSEGVAINAVQAKIKFPSHILKVANILKSDSIFTLWVQEPVWFNEKGEISFGGGLPSPGFRGRSGKIMTISFQAKSAGLANVIFKDESILENSPWAPNIFSFSQNGEYLIIDSEVAPPPVIEKTPSAPKIFSRTHSDSKKWYSNNNPKLYWETPPDVKGVSFDLNQQAVFDSGNTSEGVLDSKTFENISDGVWYFHLKIQNEFGWGKISHFKIQIDTAPPKPFEILIDNEGDPTNPYPFLYFLAEDDVSGINYYEVKIGAGDFFNVFEEKTNPFKMPHQAPGFHSIIVRAVDMAQNSTMAEAELRVESIPIPEVTVCPSVFVSGEEVMFIGGTSLPNSQVLLFFKRGDDLAKKWQFAADEVGEWFLTEEGLFRPGLYQVTARTKNIKGAISSESSPCYIKVILSGLTIGPLVVSYKDLALILLVILIFISVGIFYLFSKNKKTRNLMRIEAEDLRQKFYKEYEELQRDIEKELTELKKARGQKIISEDEVKREKDLLKNLTDIKEVFERELKDIEDIK